MTTEKPNRRIAKFLSLIFGLIILIILLQISGVFEITQKISEFNISFLLLALLLSFVGFLFFVWRWKLLVDSGVEAPVPFMELVKIELMGKFALYISPARLNIPLRAALLKDMYRIKIGQTISFTVTETIMDYSYILIIIVIGMNIFFDKISETYKTGIFVFVILFIVAIAGVFFFLRFYKTSENNFNVYNSSSDKRKTLSKTKYFFERFLESFKEGIQVLKASPKNGVGSVILTVLLAIFGAIRVYFLFQSVNYSIDLVIILIVMAFSSILGRLSNIPGGLGVYEVTQVAIYSTFGIPPEIATFVALIDRLITTGVNVPLGGAIGAAKGVDLSSRVNWSKFLNKKEI